MNFSTCTILNVRVLFDTASQGIKKPKKWDKEKIETQKALVTRTKAKVFYNDVLNLNLYSVLNDYCVKINKIQGIKVSTKK